MWVAYIRVGLVFGILWCMENCFLHMLFIIYARTFDKNVNLIELYIEIMKCFGSGWPTILMSTKNGKETTRYTIRTFDLWVIMP